MHRLAIKRTTKNEAHLSPKTHVTAFVRPPVGTVPFAASADTCAETAECRLQCMCRGVRTANLHAVRSAITATAELLVINYFRPLMANRLNRSSMTIFSRLSNSSIDGRSSSGRGPGQSTRPVRIKERDRDVVSTATFH